jgi:hypothetical protein
VRVDGARKGRWRFERADGWREAAVELSVEKAAIEVTLTPLSTDWVDHHVWAVQAP